MGTNCDALRGFLSIVQFKKREKYPCGSVTFSKVAGEKPATLLKVTLFNEYFLRFLNCTNGTKSSKISLKAPILEIYSKMKLKLKDWSFCVNPR